MQEMGVIDLWRDLYPSNRDYTHFSAPHAVCSRIDYFLIFKKERYRITDCGIGTIDMSDHSPISHPQLE